MKVLSQNLLCGLCLTIRLGVVPKSGAPTDQGHKLRSTDGHQGAGCFVEAEEFSVAEDKVHHFERLVVILWLFDKLITGGSGDLKAIGKLST